MPGKNHGSVATKAAESRLDSTTGETGADLLNEFAGAVAESEKHVKSAKEKAPKVAKVATAATPAATLADVVAKQEANPVLWVAERVYGAVKRRMAVADGQTFEQALQSVLDFYGGIVESAHKTAAEGETPAMSVGRAVLASRPHLAAKLGKEFGQPAKAAPRPSASAASAPKTGAESETDAALDGDLDETEVDGAESGAELDDDAELDTDEDAGSDEGE